MEPTLLSPEPAAALFAAPFRIVLVAALVLVLAVVAGFVLAIVFGSVEYVPEEPTTDELEPFEDPRPVDSIALLEAELLKPYVK